MNLVPTASTTASASTVTGRGAGPPVSRHVGPFRSTARTGASGLSWTPRRSRSDARASINVHSPPGRPAKTGPGGLDATTARACSSRDPPPAARAYSAGLTAAKDSSRDRPA